MTAFTSLVAVELWPPKLWYDLFCSDDCRKAVWPDELGAGQQTHSIQSFQELSGSNVAGQPCLNCGSPLGNRTEMNVKILIDTPRGIG